MNLKGTAKGLLAGALSFILLFSNVSTAVAETSSQSDSNSIYQRLRQLQQSVHMQLDFDPVDIVINDTQPVVYMTDYDNKKVVAYNYKTNKLSFLQFQLQPEKLYFSKGELYVSLLKEGHDTYNFGTQSGAIAIIDAASFESEVPAVKEQFDIDMDPYSITTDKDGIIYVSGGSAQWTSLISYDRNTKKKISSGSIRQMSEIIYNSAYDKIYDIEKDSSPNVIQANVFENGVSKDTYYYKDWGTHRSAPPFRISPDGKYIFTAGGGIFKCSAYKENDMAFVTEMDWDGEFNDVAFDLSRNLFYVAKNQSIQVYDYTNYSLLTSYYIPMNVKKLFFKDEGLVTLSQTGYGTFSIDTFDLTDITKGPALISKKEFTRLSGLNRYQTCAAIVQEAWPSADTVVLASGADFPDALSAAPLARKYNAPILLTEPKSITPETLTEIKRLNPEKIFIVGGAGAVSKDIENLLTSMNIECKRLYGNDRYATAVAVAKEVNNSEEIVLASGLNYPDALSIAPFAGFYQTPILLTDGQSLTPEVQQYIKDTGVKHSLVIGGTGAISDKIKNSIPDAIRFGGANRYETNFEIISNLGGDPTYTFFASGTGFADALAGTAVASNFNAPIILVDDNMDENVLSDWNYNKDLMKIKYILGGTGVVSDKLINKIFN